MIAASAAAFLLAFAATSASASNLLVNGDFGTGDFTGWTIYTTASGTLGHWSDPRVTSFDVTGVGVSEAAEFQAGISSGAIPAAGGGIFQTIHTVEGQLTFSAAFASLGGTIGRNLAGGVFSVLLDGSNLDSFDTGAIDAFPAVERGSLSFNTTVSAGDHILALQVTRPYGIAVVPGDTPLQYFANVSATQEGTAVPEPATWALVISGLSLVGATLRRRPTVFTA